MARILYFVTAILFAFLMDPSESAEGFFPSDLSEVTWSNAANSQAELAQAFENKTTMIKADIQMGTLGNGSDLIPIMAQPPKNTSDLSFEDFINQIIESNERKDGKDIQGVKLDFKTIETVQPALEILNSTSEKINFPIWLNADILEGPANSTGTPVDAKEFLRLASQYRPGDTLSIGWTSPPIGAIGTYTAENVKEMTDLLNQTNILKSTPITFPLRAGFAAESLDNVVELLKSWENSTITLWGSEDDPIDMRKLRNLMQAVTKNRVFVDLAFLVADKGASGINPSSYFVILAFLALLYNLI